MNDFKQIILFWGLFFSLFGSILTAEGIIQDHPLYCLLIDNSSEMSGDPFLETHAYVGALEKALADHLSKHELRIFTFANEFQEVGRMQSGLDGKISAEALGDVLNQIPDPAVDNQGMGADSLWTELSAYLDSQKENVSDMPMIGIILWTRSSEFKESIRDPLLELKTTDLPPLCFCHIDPDIWAPGEEPLAPNFFPHIEAASKPSQGHLPQTEGARLKLKTLDQFFYHQKRSSFNIETEGKGTFSNYRWYLNDKNVDDVSRGMTGALVEFKNLGAFYLQVAADYLSEPGAPVQTVESDVFVADVVPQNGVKLIDPGVDRKTLYMGESLTFGFHYVGSAKSMVFIMDEAGHQTMNLLRCRKTPQGLREKLRCEYQTGFHDQPAMLQIRAKKGKTIWELGSIELQHPLVSGEVSLGDEASTESPEKMNVYISDKSLRVSSQWQLPTYLKEFPLRLHWQLKDSAGDVLWTHMESDAETFKWQLLPDGDTTMTQSMAFDFSSLPQVSEGVYQMQARLLLEDRGKEVLLSEAFTDLNLVYRPVTPSLWLDYRGQRYDLIQGDWPNPFYVSDPSCLYWDFEGDLAGFDLAINGRHFSVGDAREYWIRDEAFRVGSRIHLELTYQGLAGNQGDLSTDVVVARPHPFWLYLPLLALVLICIGEGIYFFCGNQVADWDLYYPTKETEEIDEIPSYENLRAYHRLPLKRFWSIWKKRAKIPVALFADDEVQQYLLVRRGSKRGDDYLGQIDYQDEERRPYQFKTYPSYAHFSKFSIYEGTRQRSVFIDRHKSLFMNRYRFYFLLLIMGCVLLSYAVINYVAA